MSLAALTDWAELNDRLGRPATILCLGNGPSSEDPRIPAEHDCLFRVNWVWRKRGIRTDPRVVFTADPDLPPPDRRAILAFPTRADAERILGDHRRAGVLPPAYLVMSEMPGNFVPQTGPIPTNGALMLAAAVSLRPARLVIAGIDLYADARGKYPGELEEANEYAPIHDRDTEIAFLRAVLAPFSGEIVIVGDRLRAALGR